MSIQKKSLISTLKTAKKANVASTSHEVDAKGAKVASMRLTVPRAATTMKVMRTNLRSARISGKSLAE
jgi:hypothetical protein